MILKNLTNLFIKPLLIYLLIITNTYSRNILLKEENHVILRGSVDVDGVTAVVDNLGKKCLLLRERQNIGEQTLYLVIDSPGGSVFAGLDLITYIKSMPCSVTAIVIEASSMAFQITQNITGKRYILEYGQMMSHRASGSIGGQINTGEVESRLEHIKSILRLLDKNTCERIGISLKEYEELIKDELWANSEKAMKMNLVDEVVNIKCSDELSKNNYIDVINTFMGPMEVIYSGCPLIRNPLAYDIK